MARRVLLATTIAALVLGSPSVAFARDPDVRTYTSGDLALRGNVYWIVTARGSVLIDAPFLRTESADLGRLLAAGNAWPAGAVLLTGCRPERTWGAVDLGGTKTRVWTSVSVARAIEAAFRPERERWIRAGLPAKTLPSRAPKVTNTFTGSLNLGFEGFTLRLVEMPEMGPVASLVIQIPETGDVFAGALVWSKVHPLIEGGDISRWRRSLKTLLGLRPRRIFPGHGAPGGPELATSLVAYLDALEENVRPHVRLSKESLTGPEASSVKRVMLRKYPDWELPSTLDRSIRSEYQRQREFLADLVD